MLKNLNSMEYEFFYYYYLNLLNKIMSKNNLMLAGTVFAAAAGSFYFIVNQFKNDKKEDGQNIIDYEEVKDILSLK
jgi:hypothetical protein